MSDKILKKSDQKKEAIAKERFYGTGRRKTSIARVWVSEGTGSIVINDKPVDQYIVRDMLQEDLITPFKVTSTMSKYDVMAYVKGGGIAGQTGALRHGITRALLLVNPDFRKLLKREGLVTRDPREKEAKKYGRKRARKGYQYRKR